MEAGLRRSWDAVRRRGYGHSRDPAWTTGSGGKATYRRRSPIQDKEQLVDRVERIRAQRARIAASNAEADAAIAAEAEAEPRDPAEHDDANRYFHQQLVVAFAWKRIRKAYSMKTVPPRPTGTRLPRPRGAGRPARRAVCRSSARSGDSGDDDGSGEPATCPLCDGEQVIADICACEPLGRRCCFACLTCFGYWIRGRCQLGVLR